MTTRFVGGLLLLSTAAAAAQTPPEQQGPHFRPLREPYITSSGATVDKPGQPQGSAPTPLDRSIRRQDNAIDGSLCKSC